MSNRRRSQERRIRVRAIRRHEPDLRKLASALIELARAQAEADAQAHTEENQNTGDAA
jgi:hypothetical protein